VRAALVVAAVILALGLQSTLGYVANLGSSVNLVLVVIIFTALSLGPVAGLFTGSFAGLAQDAMSGGIVGVGGLCGSGVGFVCGVIGSQFIVSSLLIRFVVFLVGSVLYNACFLGLYALIGPAPIPRTLVSLGTQVGANAAIGTLAFEVIEGWPDFVRRRRLRRSMRR